MQSVYAKSREDICEINKDNDRKWFSQKMVTLLMCLQSIKKITVKLTKDITGNGFHKNGHCYIDLRPGDLKINSCLKKNISNVYAKHQERICKTEKDNERKPHRDRQMH